MANTDASGFSARRDQAEGVGRTQLVLRRGAGDAPSRVERLPSRGGRRRWRGLRARMATAGWFAAVPAIALAVAVLWIPIIQAAYYSFTDWNGETANWLGLANYRRLFASQGFERVLINNALLLIALPILVLGPLVMAAVVNQAGRLRGLFRTVLFMPASLSWVVTGLVGMNVFASSGQANAVLRAVGLGHLAPDWLAHSTSAFAALLLLIIWALFGMNFIIYSSGLSTFDETLFEAARIDGAGALRMFWSILIPGMASFMRFVAILSVTTMYGSLFALIYAFSSGGPGYSTTPLEFFVYQEGFSSGDYSGAAAAGVFLLVIVFLINLPQLRRFLASSGAGG